MDDSPIAYSVIYSIQKRGLASDYIRFNQYDQIDSLQFQAYFDTLNRSECVCETPLYWPFYESELNIDLLNVTVSTSFLDHCNDRTTPRSRSTCITCDQSDYTTTFEFWCDNLTSHDLVHPDHCTFLERLLKPAVEQSFHWVRFYPPSYHTYYP